MSEGVVVKVVAVESAEDAGWGNPNVQVFLRTVARILLRRREEREAS